MEQRDLKIVNNCLNETIYFYLETSGGQSSNLYLNIFIFKTPALIRHLVNYKLNEHVSFSRQKMFKSYNFKKVKKKNLGELRFLKTRRKQIKVE